MRPGLPLALFLLVACGSSGGGDRDVAGDESGPDSSLICDQRPEGACSVLQQDCPTGQGCFLTTGSAVCAEPLNRGQDEACTYENDCAAGYGCVQLAAGYACSRLCATDAGCDVPCEDVCPETFGRLTAYPGLGFCTRSEEARPCDLLAGDCPQGQACYYSSAGIACHPAASNLPVGSSCGFANDCVAFSVCVNGTCHKVCDTTSPQCPAENPRCVELPDAAGAGVCVPQQ